jgi:L-serine dehydratase
MALSVFDLFTIGIGPSSSHTVGPMRAARRFALALERDGKLEAATRVRVELFGSLGATGKGHGSDGAVIVGLEGEEPERIDPDTISERVGRVRSEGRIALLGRHSVDFRPDGASPASHGRGHDVDDDLVFHRLRSLPMHPNGMCFTALDAGSAEIASRTYYSVGGGFVVGEGTSADAPPVVMHAEAVPHPFTTGAELLGRCAQQGLSISTLVLQNECTWREEAAVRAKLLGIWDAMRSCVKRGCEREGILPGGLKVKRRAPALLRKLKASAQPDAGPADPLVALDWVNLWALAANEENAAGGRVVTAPTNGAAGVVPAVLHHYVAHTPNADDDGIARFLLVAGAIGMLYKMNASISGAEVGCQGEVGVACSMAAAALTEVLGGTPEQVENAAEIGMEHNLGLTCDPIGGLVQVPCIERNAMGAVKAINAARIALRGDGQHKVSLDKVIATMRATGADMSTKYKETARGGLAVNIVEC